MARPGWLYCGQCARPLPGREAPSIRPVSVGASPAASAPAAPISRPQPFTPSPSAPPVARPPRIAPTLSPGQGRYGAKLAIGVILCNIGVQGVMYLLERTGRLQGHTAISLGLWLGFAFYAVAFAIAVSGASSHRIEANWTVGDPRESTRRGLAVGATAPVLVLGVQTAIAGHFVGDPGVALVVSERSFTRIALAIALFVVVGPVAEEVIFRAVVVESFRHRGAQAAVAIGAFLFALAHLRPSALVYYTAMGVLLGRLYWRSGLKASILAHAAFNGCLVAVAVIAAFGPSHTFHAAGATITAPATWHESHAAGVPAGLVLSGPSGASMAVMSRPLPPGVTFDPQAVVDSAGSLPMPDGAVVGDVRSVRYKAGSGVLLTFREGEHGGELVLLNRGRTMWIFVLDAQSSTRATHDFEAMLRSVTLP